jgi:serine/threonine-protein kinase HipA
VRLIFKGKSIVLPLMRLAALLRATEAVHLENETAEDLRFLPGEGSPLGGARPKSAVRREDGGLAIAKFPKLDDTRDIGAGETLALQLTRNGGIRTAESQRVTVGSSSVTVIARFDREGGQRIPFLPAASLLGLEPGSPGSYTLMADAIRRFGDKVTENLIELWRRMVFSLRASNCDDHLLNHGFLMRKPGRWSLAPAYDLNPVPEIERAGMNQTPVSDEHGDSGIAVALEVASRLGLKPPMARKVLGEVFAAVRGWSDTGKALRLKAGTLNADASAFENPLMEEAARLLKPALNR